MGKPSNIEDWNFKSTNSKTYPAKTYSYDDGTHYEFMVIDNAVVQFTYNSEKYNNLHDESTKFTNMEDILSMFGITPSKNMKIEADTGVALRYSLLSDTIAEFWVVGINKTQKTFL